jgi:uncharacterized membrane protein
MLSGAFVASGTVHLIRPQLFFRIMPRVIPEKNQTNLIYLSGLAELICAAGLIRRTRWAPMSSLAVLTAVFPANVQMALDAGSGRNPGLANNRALAWSRLPLQVAMGWAALQAKPTR